MSECLGIYVENNIIKYAKASKDKDKIKVDAFGVKFYDNLTETIGQIIDETGSYKTPVSVNLSGEVYNYYEMFSLLSTKDLDRAIKTEFEMNCSDKGENPNAYETRYVMSKASKEKLRVIHIAANKNEITNKIQLLQKYNLSMIVPISMSITNIINTKPKENCLIVNMEQNTVLTTIINESIYDVKIIDEGSQEFLNKINAKENSFAKSYEICKNTTIYTSEGNDIQENEIGYLEDIMPTLYNIVGKIRKIINESVDKISTVYLTGTATLINNIDLYFQEYLNGVDCQILRPYFISQTNDISMQDYIEVNSAISIALSGLGEGVQGINFTKSKMGSKVPDWLKIEIGGKDKEGKKQLSEIFKNDFSEKLDKTEVGLIRTAIGLLLLFVIYTAFSIVLNNQMESKKEEANQSISSTNSQIQLLEADKSKIDSRTNNYKEMIQNLQDLNDRITDATKTRDAIPNLLNSIMYIIPENVQITSIQNTEGTHIVIEAQSNKYEQLGMFKAKLDTGMYLTNVISTSGEQVDKIIKVKIEGDLP